MTVEPLEPTPSAKPWTDEEIDLRQYVDVIVRWWREIVLLTAAVIIAAALGVIVLRLLGAPTYKASADVAIVRSFSDITLDPRFRTLSDDTANTPSSSATSRRSALLGLAKGGAIAQLVIDELGDALPKGERVASKMLDMVTVELTDGDNGATTDSDLIRISVEAGSPAKAALIVNAWAQAYVQQVNAIYGQVPDDLLTSIEAELSLAQSDYQKAQSALENFIASSRVSELRRLVNENESFIDSLQTGRQTALAALVDQVARARQRVLASYVEAQTHNELIAFDKEQEGKQALLIAYLDAINQAQIESFQEQTSSSLDLLRSYHDQRGLAALLLDDARALRDQIELGGEGDVGGSALALQLLKLHAFTPALPQDGGFAAQDQPASLGERLRADTALLQPSLALASQSGTGEEQGEPTHQPPAAPASQSVQVQLSQSPLQLQLDAKSDLTPDQLLSEADALIQTLDSRLLELDQRIADLNGAMLSGDGYENLGQTVPAQSQLVQAIREQYANLFASGEFSALSEEAAQENELSTLIQEKADDLLQMDDLRELPASGDNAGVLNQTVLQLESEVQSLKAQLEAETARERALTHGRDLTWDTFKTINNKVTELKLARAAASSEVRFAASAIPPVDPMPGVSLTMSLVLAGALGLMAAVFTAFFLDYMGKEPFLRRSA